MSRPVGFNGALLVVGLLVALPAFPEFVNGGFETGDFTGWTLSGDSPSRGVATAGTVIPGTFSGFGATVEVESGTYAGYAVVCATGPCVPSGDASDFLTLSQSVDLTVGDTYSVSIDVAAKSNAGASYGPPGAIIYVDGVPINVGLAEVSQIYAASVGTFVATDANPTISFKIIGSGSGDAGFSFDDASITDISPAPEPGTWRLALIGLGLVGFTQRRRLTKALR